MCPASLSRAMQNFIREFHSLYQLPALLIIAIALIYHYLSWATFAGLGVTLLLAPISVAMGMGFSAVDKRMNKVRTFPNSGRICVQMRVMMCLFVVCDRVFSLERGTALTTKGYDHKTPTHSSSEVAFTQMQPLFPTLSLKPPHPGEGQARNACVCNWFS